MRSSDAGSSHSNDHFASAETNLTQHFCKVGHEIYLTELYAHIDCAATDDVDSNTRTFQLDHTALD